MKPHENKENNFCIRNILSSQLIFLKINLIKRFNKQHTSQIIKYNYVKNTQEQNIQILSYPQN